MPKSLYDALRVNQTATLDEIKLAFKKRALQVHPDKGGSKEAFHLVYEALETLADPEARKKYDQGLALKSGQTQTSDGPVKKKTSTKDGRASRKDAGSKQRPPKPGKKSRDQGHAGKPHQAQQSQETKLLIKIRDLLRQLPRDTRNDVITQQFSQKQRLILEKWMVDASSGPPSQTETLPVKSVVQTPAARCPMSGQRRKELQDGDESSAAVRAKGRVHEMSATKRPTNHKIRDKKESKKRPKNACGTLNRSNSGRGQSYGARIRFDCVELFARQTDFPTALEYLVILTSVKQKVHDRRGLPSNFEERLQAALESSAQEHGRDLADLKVRFAVNQRARFFFGNNFMLTSPSVRSVEQLGQLRTLLEPFRQTRERKIRGLSWQYHPANLQETWELFQKAVAEVWEVAGVDSTKFMRKILAHYEAASGSRWRRLQSWERQHMALQDLNRYRPKSLRDRSKYLERRERVQMARQDKNEHRPRGLREKSTTSSLEHWERQQMALEDKNRHRPRRLRVSSQKFSTENRLSRKLLALKALLSEMGVCAKKAGTFGRERTSQSLANPQVAKEEGPSRAKKTRDFEPKANPRGMLEARICSQTNEVE